MAEAGFDFDPGGGYPPFMAAVAIQRLGYADFLKFPEDGNRHEIARGKWFQTPPPTTDHQLVVNQIAFTITAHAKAGSLGLVLTSPVAVALSPHDVVQPDVLFIPSRRASIRKKDCVRGAPDLVVEVSSPSTAGADRGPKSDLYRLSGVREYWIVDPFARTVEIRDFGRVRRTCVFQEGQSFTSVLLPGLVLKVSEIFSPLR
jgi:Uma2 family endonuclease